MSQEQRDGEQPWVLAGGLVGHTADEHVEVVADVEFFEQRVQQPSRQRKTARAFPDDRQFEIRDQRIVVIDEGEVDLNALLDARVSEMLHHPRAIGLIGELSPKRGQVVLRARVLDVSEQLAPLPHEVKAPPDQITRGPHRRWIDVGLRQHPTTQ